MNRIFLAIVAIVFAVGLGAFFLGVFADFGPGLVVATTLYDTDADGNADLTRQRIEDTATIWNWDRDNDGIAEIVAYDSMVDGEGSLRPTGEITAWDLGADGILDAGDVPLELQDLLRSEAIQQAWAAAGPGTVDLVDMRTRDFVSELRRRYDAWRLSGFRLPILGSTLPDADRLLPGAKRAYRFGIHQGFDMYPGHVGTPTGYGGPVIAAKAGTVVRADVQYQEMSEEQYLAAIAASQAAGTTPARELDLLRGRQVWIDHGHGIVTRYAHLSAITPDVIDGAHIDAGAMIGFVGNSGMEAAARGSRSGAHLHFELRVDDHYLGEGLASDAIRQLGRQVFGLQH